MLVKNINKETNKCNEVFVGSNTEWAISQGFEEHEVEQSYTGEYYLRGFAPLQPLKELKDLKLQELKLANENYIFAKYPQYKQNNLAIYGTEEDRLAFKNFKEQTAGYYDELIELVDNAESKEELDLINYELE